jgi:hypothetical protein
MTANRIFITAIFTLWQLALTAQENNISPYSYFGIGDIQYGDGGRTSGMASTGISLSGRTFLNTANPASLTALDTCIFVFDITGSARGSLFRTGSSRQRTFSANFSRITAGLHLTPRWSSAISLQPYSTVNYKVENDEYIEGSELTTTTTYEGSGGVTRLSLLHSFRLTEKFSLGGDVMLLFGNIDRIVSQSGVTICRNSAAVSLSFVAGLLYKERLSENLLFAAGLTYGHSGELNFSNNIHVTDASDNIVLNDALASSAINIPRSMSTGFSLTTKRIVMAADYRYQKWSMARGQASGLSFTDTHKFSSGIALLPTTIAPKNYMELIEYQAGFSVSNSCLMFKNVNPVNYEITVGAGLPLRSGGQVNLGVTWGKQGTINEGLIREDFVRFTLGLSMVERMFLKRMYE